MKKKGSPGTCGQGEVVRPSFRDWTAGGAGGAKGEGLHPRFSALHPRQPAPTYQVNLAAAEARK